MTDPFDGNDRLQILNIVPKPGFDGMTNRVVVVTVRTFPGLTYSFKSDPEHRDFQPVSGGAFTADDHTKTFELTLAPGGDLIPVRRDP